VELPPVEMLAEPPLEAPELSAQELDAAADQLEATLRSFGVEGEVKDVRPGPVVTTYEYQPGPGIRVNQIVQRANDLALAMRARSLRMEAPIPGKAAVGIEIPNQHAQLVSLREVLQLERGKGRQPLTVSLGKDVIGQPVSIDLAAQPHLLVAGSTGSGKSVCLNAMITNLLLYNDPARLRLLLIDPKMLELNVYNGVPHLLLPVVTDPKEALRAMNWMVAQMDQRYRLLADHAVRNIEQYNDKVARGEVVGRDGEPVTDPMPYYVTIVDELADLMVQLGQDFEVPVTRLAQKARAVGLHLVLATQRPSVDVLTGVIKANIPCRIAFRVIQRNDSRTILDQNGAEQLLGRGDMLYLMPGRAQPVRVHGAFVDVAECEAVAGHWQQYGETTEEISLTAGPDGGLGVHSGEDDLFADAVRVVVSHQSGSTSLLQRRLRIGYTRAGRLMDMMEEAGIVGPFTGSKARDVLVKPADLPDLFGDAPAEDENAT
jgi:S-DNA-T family DNA segregation ATPase FtsK/SpoIIIE